ncbi:flagellar basal body P-ring formation chaperone FlgA [Verticiella sediminum]
MASAPAAATPADTIAAAVTDYLVAQAAHLPGVPQVRVEAGSAARHPACDAPEAFLPPGTRLRARMSVGVRCAAPNVWTAYVQAQLSVPGDAWVAARPIDAGQPITAEDLAPRAGDLLALPATAILHPEQAIGAVATRRIAAGRELRTDALRSADAVLRGQTVRLVVHGAGFTATGEGQTLAAAGPGMPVQVRTASGQLVNGIVRDAGTVEVPL